MATSFDSNEKVKRLNEQHQMNSIIVVPGAMLDKPIQGKSSKSPIQKSTKLPSSRIKKQRNTESSNAAENGIVSRNYETDHSRSGNDSKDNSPKINARDSSRTPRGERIFQNFINYEVGKVQMNEKAMKYNICDQSEKMNDLDSKK